MLLLIILEFDFICNRSACSDSVFSNNHYENLVRLSQLNAA